jgi:hypothetical protein
MKKQIIFLMLWCSIVSIYGQNVTIKPNSITPGTNSIYQKLSYNAIQTLLSPTKGDMVYDLTFKCVRVYNGSKWVALENNNSKPNYASIKEFTNGQSYFGSIKFDLTGNMIVSGVFKGAINFNGINLVASGTSYDFFIGKFTKDGLCLWATSSTGTGSSSGVSLGLDASGNIYFAGEYSGEQSFGGTTVNSVGNSDIFIGKLNNAGAFQWLQTAGGNGQDTFNGLSIDPTGGIYIIGNFESTASFGSLSVISAGSADFYFAKYSSIGASVWVQRGGGIRYDDIFSAVVDASGNLYISANDNTGINGSISLLNKYSSTGVLLWSKTGTDNYGSRIDKLIIDNANNIVGVGYFGNSFTFDGQTRTTAGSGDIFLLKYNPAGTQLAFDRYGGYGTEVPNTLATDATGNIYIGGTFQQNITINGVSPGKYRYAGDAFLFKLNSSGALQWLETLGGPSTDSIFGLIVDSNNELFFTGSTSVNTTIGNSSIPTSASSIIRLQQQ